jgi:hypothetical protein
MSNGGHRRGARQQSENLDGVEKPPYNSDSGIHCQKGRHALASISQRSPAPAIQIAGCPHPSGRSPARIPGPTLSQVRQTILSLRQAGFARPRPELLAHQRIGGQDGHQDYSALRCGADTSADRRVQAVSRLNPRVCRGQRKSLRRTTACDDQQCRARS